MVCLSRRYRSGNVTLCVPHEAFFRFNLNIGGKYFSRHLTLVGTRPLVPTQIYSLMKEKSPFRGSISEHVIRLINRLLCVNVK